MFRADIGYAIDRTHDIAFKAFVIDKGYTWIAIVTLTPDAKIADITAALASDKYTTLDLSEYQAEVRLEIKDAWISILNRTITIYARSPDAVKNAVNQLDKYLVKELKGNLAEITYMYQRNGMLDSASIVIDKNKIDPIYPGLYPDILVDELIEEFNAAKESILIIYGEPGTGKTTFIKDLILKSYDKNIAYLKDKAMLNEGAVWAELNASSYDLIIFDDLDDMLHPRAEGGNNFVTQLLSLSDGIFPKNHKIVITTNIPITEMDEAIIRPGRCFDFLILNPLTYNQALKVWTETLGQDIKIFESLYADCKVITQASIMSNYNRATTNKVNRSYVRNGNQVYSVEEKMKQLGIGACHGFTA